MRLQMTSPMLPSTDSSAKPSSESSDDYRNFMEHLFRDAIEARKAVNTVQWDVDSIRSIALTMFMQRARA